MSATSCPWCCAETVRLPVRGTVRAVDAMPSPTGTLVVDLHAGTTSPCKIDGPSFSGNRHHLHRDTCPDWHGPVGG